MKRKIIRRRFEVRAAGAEAGAEVTRIEGYAAVFNQIAYGEVIRPGAFTKTLAEQDDIKAFWSHDSAKPLGRTTNGTLTLRQDAHGLAVVITPNQDTSFGRDALAAVARGDVSQMSFGFSIINAARETVDGEDIDVLRELRLYEVSPVAEPWYEGTDAQARELELSSQRGDAGGDAPEPGQAAHSTRDAVRAAARGRELELLKLQEVSYDAERT